MKKLFKNPHNRGQADTITPSLRSSPILTILHDETQVLSIGLCDRPYKKKKKRKKEKKRMESRPLNKKNLRRAFNHNFVKYNWI